MNVGLTPADDARHRMRAPLSYEWWYFDAAFSDGHGVVAIIWPMNYSKPWRRQCTVQLSIYTPEGGCHKDYAFPARRLFSASYNTCDVTVGDSFMRGAWPRYEVRVASGGLEVDLEFEARTPGWKPGTAVNYLPFPLFKSMGWLVPLPVASVSGMLRYGGRELSVEGHGYHDHNWGEAPIFHMVDNWNWGHLVSGDLAVTWADITMYRGIGFERTYMLLVSHGDRLVYESPSLRVDYSDWRREPGYLHPYPATVSVSFGSRSEPVNGALTMSVQRVVETQDLLQMVGIPDLLERLVHRFIAKPYYFRWDSLVKGSVEMEGRRFDIDGRTIHEQMLFRGRMPERLARDAL
ncbi:MAG: hypothetical protein KKE36_02810 [Actinobacteria bacterium]|nr:hypothetical protein [Actinomycetota bacterium]